MKIDRAAKLGSISANGNSSDKDFVQFLCLMSWGQPDRMQYTLSNYGQHFVFNAFDKGAPEEMLTLVNNRWMPIPRCCAHLKVKL